ncbi:hypothetical protein [Ponticaulis sp.]|uniref:hypothetical protein n=1 Tax=Ponticaulis sp. TaxID=2020902 RepID=UPI00260BB4C5|nr:hypothetical protein [Ponticaulis sp.]MDF1680233.1 hypothetical protein [Ponticaulis sp.]
MTNQEFSINGNNVEIHSAAKGRISVDLGSPIAQVLSVKSALVVRTEPEPGSCENCNVFAIGSEGDLFWKVKSRKHVYDDSPYTHIELTDGKLVLINWDGLRVIVDPETFSEESEFYGR